jgi:hypothetical protein
LSWLLLNFIFEVHKRVLCMWFIYLDPTLILRGVCGRVDLSMEPQQDMCSKEIGLHAQNFVNHSRLGSQCNRGTLVLIRESTHMHFR